MLRIGWLIVVDWPEPPLTYAALAPHGAQPGPVFPAQSPVGIPWVIHGGRLLAIPRRSFYSNSFKHYPPVIEIYGIKIRHRSRCLRPSVWPTPAADNRLPVRWTRAVDANHTAAHAAAALKTAPEPLRFALRIKADLHRRWPILALLLAELGPCAEREAKQRREPESPSRKSHDTILRLFFGSGVQT